MNYEKLSPALAALTFEYLRFPEATINCVSRPRPQNLSLSASNSLTTEIFIHCDENAEFENSPGIRLHSGGEIRTARVELDAISDLSERGDVSYLSCSMRRRASKDSAALEKSLAEFKDQHSELNESEIVFGIINSGLDVSQTFFAERLHGIWDQTLAGDGAGSAPYGKILSGDSLWKCADGDGHGNESAKVFAEFAASFGNSAVEKNLIVVKTDFQAAHLADAIRYVFETAQQANKIAVVAFNLENDFDNQENFDDLSAFINQQIGDEKFIIPIIENDAERKNQTTKSITPGKFSPTKFNFVVPSNSQPGSPPEVALRGWIAADGVCEIIIAAPNGGVTKSTQAEVVEGNPTRFGHYSSSQAFLTKPKIVPDGRREFFIDLSPVAPKEFVTGGVWKLTVTNVGDHETAASVSLWVPPNAKDAEFI